MTTWATTSLPRHIPRAGAAPGLGVWAAPSWDGTGGSIPSIFTLQTLFPNLMHRHAGNHHLLLTHRSPSRLQPCHSRLIPTPVPAAPWKWVFNLCRLAAVPPTHQQQPHLAATRIKAGEKRHNCCPATAAGCSHRETWPAGAAKAIELQQHTKEMLLLCLDSSHGACGNGSWVQSVSTTFPLHTATGSALHSHPALPTAQVPEA